MGVRRGGPSWWKLVKSAGLEDGYEGSSCQKITLPSPAEKTIYSLVTNTIRRIAHAVGVFVTVTFLATVLTPIVNYIADRFAVRPAIQPCEAIVVLGGGVWKGGMLDDQSLRRTIRGIELYKNNLAPRIILSGPVNKEYPEVPEAKVREQLALAMGVPEAAIIIDERANTTREESVRIARILQGLNIHRILLVTESLHMRRATYLFERAGIEVSPAPSDNFAVAATSPGQRLRLGARIAQETAALIYYRLAGYI